MDHSFELRMDDSDFEVVHKIKFSIPILIFYSDFDSRTRITQTRNVKLRPKRV